MVVIPVNAPCFECEHRSAGCHGRCSEYKQYEEEMAQRREQRAFRAMSAGCSRKRLDKHCRKIGIR